MQPWHLPSAVKWARGAPVTSTEPHAWLPLCAGDFLRKSFDIKADAFGFLKGRQVGPLVPPAQLDLPPAKLWPDAPASVPRLIAIAALVYGLTGRHSPTDGHSPQMSLHEAHMCLAALQTFVIAKDGTCVFTYRDQFGAEKHVQVSLQ